MSKEINPNKAFARSKAPNEITLDAGSDHRVFNIRQHANGKVMLIDPKSDQVIIEFENMQALEDFCNIGSQNE